MGRFQEGENMKHHRDYAVVAASASTTFNFTGAGVFHSGTPRVTPLVVKKLYTPFVFNAVRPRRNFAKALILGKLEWRGYHYAEECWPFRHNAGTQADERAALLYRYRASA